QTPPVKSIFVVSKEYCASLSASKGQELEKEVPVGVESGFGSSPARNSESIVDCGAMGLQPAKAARKKSRGAAFSSERFIMASCPRDPVDPARRRLSLMTLGML